jgi:vitamin B12 transporter
VEGSRLLRRPTHQLAARLGVSAWDRLSGGVGLRRVGDRIDRDFGQVPAVRVELPAYTVVDLDAQYDLLDPAGGGPGLTLLARIENLFDERYEEVSGFPNRGRTVLAGGAVRVGGR